MTTSWEYRFGARTYDLQARTHIMGILNVTPDSFSDGGKFLDPERAVDHALQMIDEGADFIDIGGESSRPKGRAYGEGARPVNAEEELARVLPVIQRLVGRTDIPISIDTTKSAVARQALDAGAVIVNDISGLAFDSGMAETVARRKASIILMHMKGSPQTMQQNPEYHDLFGEVGEFLQNAVARAREAGIRQILVDPGIGFGKTVEHNLQLIKGAAQFHELGCPVVIGASRKSFLGALSNLPPDQRLEGSIAAAAAAILYGANVVRVHDVAATKRAALIADALHRVPLPVPHNPA